MKCNVHICSFCHFGCLSRNLPCCISINNDECKKSSAFWQNMVTCVTFLHPSRYSHCAIQSPSPSSGIKVEFSVAFCYARGQRYVGPQHSTPCEHIGNADGGSSACVHGLCRLRHNTSSMSQDFLHITLPQYWLYVTRSRCFLCHLITMLPLCHLVTMLSLLPSYPNTASLLVYTASTLPQYILCDTLSHTSVTLTSVPSSVTISPVQIIMK